MIQLKKRRRSSRKKTPAAIERNERVTKFTTQKVLATIIVFAWIIIQFFLLTHEVFDSMREIIMRTLGTLDMMIGTVIHFYFNMPKDDERRDPDPPRERERDPCKKDKDDDTT